MTEEERSRIISGDYADFIIDYRNNPAILNGIAGGTIYILNDVYAIIHIPMSQLIGRNIRNLRLAISPSLYGLTSEVSLEASGVDALQNIPNFNLRGQGVLVGIIDTGVDYMQSALRKADGTTKIVSIWDQTIQSDAGYPFDTRFGTEYTRDQINTAITSENPLDIVPSTDGNGHGTMLASVAVGTENASEDFYGVAPDSELVIVKLRQAKEYLREYYSIPEGVVCYQENHIMWGVQYCYQMARQLNRPIAICIGVGSSQTAHDERSPLSQQLSIVADIPRIGVVIAVGNEGNRGRHYRGIIDPAIGNTTVELNVGENEGGFFMQLWGDSPGIYSIDILSPSGEYIPRIPATINVFREISFIFEPTEISVEYQTVESQTGDQLILLIFRNVSSGIWRFTVYGQGNLPLVFNIWLPMGDFITNDTYFIQPDIYTTVLAPSPSFVPIAVTAYNPISGTLYVNASRGFTRNNIVKPELAAPGVNYLAPALSGGYTNYSGTGVAAAHTAGIVALTLEWGIIRGNEPSLDTLAIKKFLIRGAKRTQNLSYPNRDWGYGILDIFNTFDVLRSNI